jgi:hypothetical protein
MKYGMGWDGLRCNNIHIPSFIKIGSGIQKLTGGIHRHTDNMVIA